MSSCDVMLKRLVLAAIVLIAGMSVSGCDYFRSPEQRVSRAEQFVSEGQYRRALVELKNALDKQPGLPEGRLLLAEVAFHLGDIRSAEVELKKVPPDTEPARFADLGIRIDLAAAQYKKALDALDAGPPVVTARASLYRGQALQGLGDFAAAEAEFERSVTTDPTLVDGHVGRIRSLVSLRKVDEASHLSERIIEEFPQSMSAWQVRGELLALRGDMAGAAGAFARARQLVDGRTETLRAAQVLVAHAETQVATRDVDGARATSAELSRLLPGSSIAMLVSGRVSMLSDDYAAATTQLRQLVNASPRMVQARFLLGMSLAAQGNLEQASQELREVVQQAPENVEARQLLGQVRLRLQDPDGALQVLVPAIQTNPDDPAASALFNAALATAGGDSAAVGLLESALANAPDNETLRLQLAGAYLQAGTPEKALRVLRSSEGNASDTRRSAALLVAVAQSQGVAAARAQAEQLVAKHPTDSATLGLVGGFYARTGDFETARRLLATGLERAPQDPVLLFALANTEVAAKQLGAAEKYLLEMLKLKPADTVARYRLVEIQLARGDTVSATAQLEKLRADDPQAVQPRLLLARLAIRREAIKEADALVAEAVTAGRSSVDVLSASGLLYLGAARYDQAIAKFQEATRKEPGNPAVWMYLGRAQAALDQSAAARESFERALSLRPNWVAAAGALIFMELQHGENAAAMARLETLKQARPKDPAVLALEGEVLAILRRYDEASKAFEAAYALQPAAAIAARNYAVRRTGELPQPAVLLERWVNDNPRDVSSTRLLAEAYTTASDYRRASQQYERAIALAPDDVASLNNLAWLYQQVGDGRAVDVARKAHGLAPGSAAVADTLGWILVESGRASEGLPILQQAAMGSGADKEIQYHYAVALHRTGSSAEARAVLQRLLSDREQFASRSEAERLVRGLPET